MFSPKALLTWTEAKLCLPAWDVTLLCLLNLCLVGNQWTLATQAVEMPKALIRGLVGFDVTLILTTILDLHLQFGEDRDAILLFDERHFLPNDGFIGFEHGTIKIHGNFWCPTEITLITNGGEKRTMETFPLNDDRKFIYPNSAGLRYGEFFL